MFQPENYFFNIQALPSFMIGVTTLLMGVFVLAQRNRKSIHVAFFSLSISITIWLIATALGCSSINEHLAAQWFKIDNFGVLFISVSIYFFTRKVLELKANVVAYFGAICAFFLGIFVLSTDWLVLGVQKFFWGYFPKWGWLSIPVFLVFFGYMQISFILLIKTYLKGNLSVIKKNQAKYLIVGYLIGYTGAVDFLPTFDIIIYPFGCFSFLAFLSILSYSIIRHHLMDIRVAAGKVIITLCIYGLIALLPFGLFSITNKTIPAWGTFAFLCGLAPYTISSLEKKFKSRIYRKEYARQQLLAIAGKTTIEITEMNNLVDWTVKTVSSMLNIANTSIFLNNPEKQKFVIQASCPNTIPRGFLGFQYTDPLISFFMENKLNKSLLEHDIEELLSHNNINNSVTQENLKEIIKNMRIYKAPLIIPIRFRDNLLAILLAGEKNDGQLYTPEDIETLELFAENIASAIKNIRLYDELKDMQAKLIQEEKWATLGRLGTSTKHELGTPVAIVNMYTQNLLMKIKKDAESPAKNFIKYVEDIYEQSNRIMSVIQTIHQLPKEAQEKMEPLKLDDIIDKSFELAKFQTYWENLGGTNLELKWPKDLPPIKGNMVHLQGVFLNLIINSYQIMQDIESTQRKITIEAGINPYQSKFLQILFYDSGKGIPNEHIPRIFEYRYTTRKKGHGIGLFLCKYFIEKIHNGTIEVENIPEKGTCFIIDLPIWKEPEESSDDKTTHS